MVLCEKGVETGEKWVFSRLCGHSEPLQNRGSRVRILLPLPSRKVRRKSDGLFCLVGLRQRRIRRGAVVNDNTVCCQSRDWPRSVAKPRSNSWLCGVATRPNPPANLFFWFVLFSISLSKAEMKKNFNAFRLKNPFLFSVYSNFSVCYSIKKAAATADLS